MQNKSNGILMRLKILKMKAKHQTLKKPNKEIKAKDLEIFCTI